MHRKFGRRRGPCLVARPARICLESHVPWTPCSLPSSTGGKQHALAPPPPPPPPAALDSHGRYRTAPTKHQGAATRENAPNSLASHGFPRHPTPSLLPRFHTYNIPLADPVATEYVATMLADEDMAAWEAAALKEVAVIAKYDAAALEFGGEPR
jgi:hypothetical protein